MMRLRRSRFVLAVVVGAGVLHIGAANAAMDAKSVADTLSTGYAAAVQGVASYATATFEGADIVVTGFVVEGKVSKTAIDRLVIADPAPRTGKDGFTARSITYGLTKTEVQTTTSVTMTSDSTVLEDVTVLPPDETDPLLGAIHYARGSAKGLTVSESSLGQLLTADDSSFATTDAGGLLSMSFLIGGIRPPPSLTVPDGPLAQLGYPNGVVATFQITATFNQATGLLTLDAISLSAPELGKITLTAAIGGLTGGKVSDGKAPLDERLLAIYTAGTIQSVTLRIDNQGLADKILDMQAKSAGVSRPVFANSLAKALPLLLVQAIRDPPFRNAFAQAAGSFLKEPKSLAITANPLNPVPFAQVMISLENLPELLRLDARVGE